MLPKKTQSRLNFWQLVQGCDLLHFNFRLRHSRQLAIIRFLLRILGVGWEEVVAEALLLGWVPGPGGGDAWAWVRGLEEEEIFEAVPAL